MARQKESQLGQVSFLTSHVQYNNDLNHEL